MVEAFSSELMQKDETVRPLEQLLGALEFGEKWKSQVPLAVRDNSLVELFKGEVRFLVPTITASLERVLHSWEQLCLAGRSGRAAEVDGIKNELQESVEAGLRLGDRAIHQCEIFQRLTGELPPERDELANANEKLRRLKSDILGRWHTLEDLEQILVESFPLAAHRLEKIGKKCQPSASWYQEEGKPF